MSDRRQQETFASPTKVAGGDSSPSNCSAVRWAIRTKGQKPFDEPAWTKWHATADSCLTLCGWPIIIATKAAFLPDCDDDLSKVGCSKCRRKLDTQNAGTEQPRPEDEAKNGN